jgi:hypothetical protein
MDIKADLMGEVSRVLCAAIVNPNFREALLDNPMKSIEYGYCGETFHLPANLLHKIAEIKCKTLEHFSSEVISLVDSLSIQETAGFAYC